jgi:hypothetical protein
MMEMNLNDDSFDEFYVVSDDGSESFAIFVGLEDFNSEFLYEDFERMTGKSYQSYLRIHDDMT